MNSAKTNRDTLFQMEGLTGAEPVISPTEPEGYVTKEPPPLLDRSVLKKNAPKRKRTLSPPRRVGNRPGVQLEYKGMKDGSPWDSYWKSFQVKYTEFVTVAVRKGGRRKCVVVKSDYLRWFNTPSLTIHIFYISTFLYTLKDTDLLLIDEFCRTIKLCGLARTN